MVGSALVGLHNATGLISAGGVGLVLRSSFAADPASPASSSGPSGELSRLPLLASTGTNPRCTRLRWIAVPVVRSGCNLLSCCQLLVCVCVFLRAFPVCCGPRYTGDVFVAIVDSSRTQLTVYQSILPYTPASFDVTWMRTPMYRPLIALLLMPAV